MPEQYSRHYCGSPGHGPYGNPTLRLVRPRGCLLLLRVGDLPLPQTTWCRHLLAGTSTGPFFGWVLLEQRSSDPARTFLPDCPTHPVVRLWRDCSPRGVHGPRDMEYRCEEGSAYRGSLQMAECRPASLRAHSLLALPRRHRQYHLGAHSSLYLGVVGWNLCRFGTALVLSPI